MKVLRLVCAISALVYLGVGDAYARDLSNFPGCVWENRDDVDRDILTEHLKYQSIDGKETDESNLHSEFMGRVLQTTTGASVNDNTFYVTFAVYYKFEKGIYKQFASAIACRGAFGSAENKCRNRTYFTFSEISPTEWADALVRDISRSKPIIRGCRFPGDAHELHDSSSAGAGGGRP